MTTVIPVLCQACVHLRRNGTCDAFPAGRPEGIAKWGEQHLRPVPGDHGIQFELKRGKEQALEDWRLTFGLDEKSLQQ